MKKLLLALAVLSLALAFSGPPAQANSIIILNPSFENPVISTAGDSVDLIDWSGFGLGTPTLILRPTTGPMGEVFVVPDGQNVGRIGPGGSGGIISQILTATLQANTTYTLQVDVGQSTDVPLTSFTVALFAENIGLFPLVVDNRPPGSIPAPGTFLTDTLVFDSGPNPPALGLALGIHLETPSQFSGMALFDNVRLDATLTAIPLPPAAWLLGSGLLGLIGFRKKFLA